MVHGIFYWVCHLAFFLDRQPNLYPWYWQQQCWFVHICARSRSWQWSKIRSTFWELAHCCECWAIRFDRYLVSRMTRMEPKAALMVKKTPYRPNNAICSTLDQLRRFWLGLSHSKLLISVTLECTNRYSTHSCAPILKKVYRIPLLLLHRQERDHAHIHTNQHRRCQYRGYNCRTALNQLSKWRVGSYHREAFHRT